MPELPENLLKSGRFNRKVDVLMGTMLSEGYILTALTMPGLVSKDMTVEKLRAFIMSDITHRYSDLPAAIREDMANEAMKVYFKNTTPDGLAEASTTFFGDSLLVAVLFVCKQPDR
jgi:hypothetical protein